MRLNQSHKQMVISAIMEDVPKVDYNEQFRTLVMSYWEKYALPAVKDMVKAGHEDQLNKEYWGAYGLSSVATYGVLPLPAEAKSTFVGAKGALIRERQKQIQQSKELRAKIAATVNSCSTLKQLKDRLPEFEKYFPKDQPVPTPNLPVANLIADLQAAGWPKDQTK